MTGPSAERYSVADDFAIEVRALTYAYPRGVTALDSVSFAIAPGEMAVERADWASSILILILLLILIFFPA